MVSEHLITYQDSSLVSLESISFLKKGYGLIFKKGSAVGKVIKPILDYYYSSPKYYQLIKESFGKQVAKIIFNR